MTPKSCASKNSFSASPPAAAASARAIGDPGPLELVANTTSAVSTGSTISTARISGPGSDVHSQVCGTMDAQFPADAAANSEATESVST